MKWRLTLISTFMAILSLFSIGAVKEFGQDIQYPVQAGFSISQTNSLADYDVLFQELDRIARDEKIHIYHPFLADDGRQKTFVFGDPLSATVVDTGDYIQDLGELAASNPIGIYYITKSVPESLKSTLRELEVSFSDHELSWYLIPIYFLFTNLRSLAIWSLFLVFSLAFFSIKLMFAKKAMIYRSLGYLNHIVTRDIIQDCCFLLGSFVISGLGFTLYQGTISSIFVKTFWILMIVNALITGLVIGLNHILFYVSIRLVKPAHILKNQKLFPLIRYIWLVGICLSTILFAKTLQVSLTTIKESQESIQVLNYWNQVNDFVSLVWFENTQLHTDANHKIDSRFLSEENQKHQTFVNAFEDGELIYSKPSHFNQNLLGYAPPTLIEELKNNQINFEVSEKIRYLSKGAILKNLELFPENQYGQIVMDGPGIIYIPSSLMARKEEIYPIINYEWLQNSSVRAEEFIIQEIPDNQKTFLFNHEVAENDVIADQIYENLILVSFNLDYLAEEGQSAIFYSVVFNAIFNQDKVKRALEESGLDHFSNMIKVSEKLIIERNKILSQLKGSLLALVMLFLAQCFVIYQYMLTIFRQQAKRLVIMNILGQSTLRELLKLLLPYLLGILFTMVLVAMLTGSGLITLGIGCVYIIESLLMASIGYKSLLNRRVSILKGDFEI